MIAVEHHRPQVHMESQMTEETTHLRSPKSVAGERKAEPGSQGRQ